MSRLAARSWAITTNLRKNWKYFLSGLAVVFGCLALRMLSGPGAANATPPAGSQSRQDGKVTKASATAAAEAPANVRPQVVATVNGEQISRQELARAAAVQFGKEVLETLVNRQLILDHCKQQSISISQKEIDDEVDHTARRFRLSVDEYLKMLERERNVKPKQYAQDIVWPTLALRRLAAVRLTVSEQELNEAYDTEFGPMVKARLIAVDDPQKAQAIQAKAHANPDDFGNLAKKYSQDVNSASVGGLIQPIRRNVGDKKLEQAAFRLREGEVSPVIPVENQFVILKCEGQIPDRQGVSREQAREQLVENIKDRKLRSAAGDVFKRLQADARVENIMNDPVKSKQFPGVAATINGTAISLRDLNEECIERHGEEVLEGVISHRLLEQALRDQKLKVTDRDIDDEIAHVAVTMNKVTKDGRPDVDGWLQTVVKQSGSTVDAYVEQSVWPAAALKKLIGEVEVTREDMQKGFDANYGPRARCRAIVLNSQRKAQEVWELARAKPTVENFGKLAEQFSIEPGSKALQGKVPPIPKNGGNPVLEREAFSLQPGDLSGIIQLADKFVVLFCEGYTEPTKVTMKDVQQDIYSDILEKKQRLAMAKRYDDLKENASIANELTHSLQKPKAKDVAKRAGGEVGPPTNRK